MTVERGGAGFMAVVVAIALAAAGRAEAALGEPAGGIAADRQALGAAPRGTVSRPGYVVERMQSAAHEVREFVAASGVVFGVAWDGISHPDLDTLLGAYAQEYRTAAERERSASRRHRAVRTGRVVVLTWGHMRSLHGRAWVPALVPQGVTADEIR